MNGEAHLHHMLGYGKENVISSYDLAQDLDMNQRAIGFMVRQMRLDGIPVGSIPGKGYYLIETREELEETKAHILHRHKGLNETVKALDWGFDHREKTA
ncbi:MAG: hypothetical protein JWM90_3116 [Thermoleophilia bacterium]|nr:hypothetical protein [Thermoleophilia bacterium]